MDLVETWHRIVGKFPAQGDSGETPSKAGSERQVTRPEQITRVLQLLHDRHALVTVSLPETREKFTSSILGLNPEQDMLLMDELTPLAGHKRLIEARRLQVFSRIQGIEVGFQGTLADLSQHDGIAVYQVPIPKILRYNQRRAYFRAAVGSAQPVPVYLDLPDSGIIMAELQDISVGGIGAQLTSSADCDLEPGLMIPSCTIELPDGKSIRSALDVRFASEREKVRKVRLGARFLDLDKTAERSILHFVTELDRKRRHRG